MAILVPGNNRGSYRDICVKSIRRFTKIVPSIIVVAGYAVAFFFLSLTLKDNINIGVVYAIWSGVGVSLISVIGIYIISNHWISQLFLELH